MHNILNKVVCASLATATVGLTALGSVGPVLADVYSYRNGHTPAAFAPTEVMRLGLSPVAPVAGDFRAIFAPSDPSPGSCSPTITRHQKTDNYSYSAGCAAF
jgi:hypothetical protein